MIIGSNNTSNLPSILLFSSFICYVTVVSLDRVIDFIFPFILLFVSFVLGGFCVLFVVSIDLLVVCW